MDKIDQKTQEELERLASFPQLNPNPVIEVDYEGKITYLNPATVKILKDLGLDKTDVTPFLPQDLDVILKDLKKETGTSLYREAIIKDKIYGETVHLLPQFKTVRIYVHDITARKLAEEEIVGLNAELEKRVEERTIELKREIEERSRIEQKLQESSLRLQATLRAANVGLWDWDLRTNKVFYSPEWKRQIGYEDSEITNDFSEWQSRVHPDDLDRSIKTIRAFIENPWPDYRLEFRFRHKDGAYRWILTQASLICDEQGKPIRMLGSHVDITERRKAEEELMLSRQWLTLHMEQNPLAVIEFDLDGRIRGWNPAAERTFGFSRKEAIGQHWTIIVPEAIRGQLEGVWEKLVAQQGGTRSTNENRMKDGRAIICEWFSTPLVTKSGDTIGVASLVMDITERKQAESALKTRERQLAESQRIAHIGSWEHNRSTGQVIWSDEMFRLLGFDPATDEADFEAFLERVHPEDRAALKKVIKEAVRLHAPFSIDYRYIPENGTTRVLHSQAELIHDDTGGPAVLRGTCQDITVRKQAETEREQFYKLFQTSSDLMAIADPNGAFKKTNPAFTETLGYSEAELVSRPFVEFVHPDDKQMTIDEMARQLQRGFSLNFENRYICRDGSFRWLSWRAIYDKEEGVTYATARDTTEIKQAEDALRASEHKYRALIETTNTGYVIVDQHGNVLDANPEYVRLTGHNTLEEIAGRNVVEWTAAEDREKNAREVKNCMELGFVRGLELRYTAKEGLTIPIEINATVIKDVAGPKILSICRDITERKQTEEALRHANSYNRNLIEVSLDPLVTIGPDGKITDVNTATEAVTGLMREVLIDTDFSSYFTEPDKAREGYEEVFRTGFVRDYPLDIEHRDGTITSVLYNASVYKDDAGNVIGVFAAARDITARKKIEEALQKSEAFVKNILETVDEGFIVIDTDYKIISANKAYLKMVNKSEENVIGGYCYRLSHKLYKPCCEVGEDCAVNRTLKTGEPQTAAHTHYDESKHPVYVEIKSFPVKDGSGKVVAAIEVINDITEKKKLEDQLRQAQKMEAVGTLAGGIAHDFNNILNVIIGFGTMVMDRLGEDVLAREQLSEVLAAADRAASLTKRLLLFSRKEVAEMKPLDVNGMVLNMEKMLSRIIGEDIRLITELMSVKAMVMADAGQMEQVLMNLATNARDAMPEGGSLTIKTELRKIDTEFVDAYNYGAPGAYAVISITDTGMGIDKEKQVRIFDPFFTTKEVGRGTGLGLSIAYGIIKQHNGYIKVYSEPGEGTTFKIWLPVIDDTAEKGPEAEVPLSMKGGTETILVAEDDASLRKLTRTILEAYGYTVIAAEDGEDAIMKFMENREKIQLVILDMIMPGKSGKEVSEVIRGKSFLTKILFVSGYTMNTVKTQEIIKSGFDFIHKPVLPKELLRKVREVLDRRVWVA